jgi:hypothetical protein
MKKILFLMLCLHSVLNVEAQTVKSQFGEQLKFKGGIDFSRPIALVGNTLYAVATKPRMFSSFPETYITLIDAKTLKVTSTEELEFENKKTDVLDVFMAQGQKWVFTRNTNKKTKVDIIEAFALNADGKKSEKAAPMAEFMDKKSDSFFGWEPLEAGATIVYSPDSTKIGLVVNANLKKKENELFYLKVFNIKDMSKVWEQVVKLPYSEKRYVLQSAVVNDNGNIQFTGKLFNDEKAKESLSKTVAGYKFVLHDFDGKMEKGNEFLIDLGGKFIESSFVKIRPDNGNTVASGFYANERNGVVNGVYYIEVAKGTNNVVNKFITNVPGDKIKYITKTVHNKSKNGLEAYTKVKDVYFKKNGNMIITASTYHYTVTHNIQKGTTTVTHHDFDAIALSFTPKGVLEWGTSAAKFATVSISFSAFGPLTYYSKRPPMNIGTRTFFKDDNLFFIYNDDVKNEDKDLNKEPSRLGMFDKVGVMLTKIDSKGALDRSVLVTKKELDGYWFGSAYCISLGDDEFIFAAVKQSFGNVSHKIGRIKLK